PPNNPGIDTEMVFPGNADIAYGQHLFRPESKDVDLYRFSLPKAGKLTVEISAERLANPSLLDASLRLYRLNATGGWDEIARNDDYFSQDSLILLNDLSDGEYIVGVSAKGTEGYDPKIDHSGLGGRSEGQF
ncbi:MAG: PPC domain-containing protein, partial [Pirellulaceae bacterium]